MSSDSMPMTFRQALDRERVAGLCQALEQQGNAAQATVLRGLADKLGNDYEEFERAWNRKDKPLANQTLDALTEGYMSIVVAERFGRWIGWQSAERTSP